MASPTADWTRLHDTFYRKIEIYQMMWDVDLSMYIAAVGAFGGPIAISRDTSIIVRANRAAMNSDIQIYTAAGSMLASIKWNKGQIIKLLWTNELDLVVVVDDGTVYLFDIHGSFIRSFSMGRNVRSSKVIDCQGWGSGLVVLSGDFQFYKITNYVEPRPQKMGEIPYMDGPPSCWSVLDPRFTADQQPELIVAFGNHIYTVDDANAKLQPCEEASYTQIGISPNGKLVALFNSSGLLSVTSSDFQRTLSETKTQTVYPPSQLVWCGTDSVVANWDNIVLMMGPYGPWTTYNCDSSVYLVPEIDGVRIIGTSLHEFLQKVPNVVQDIFKIGSISPAASLFDATKLFQDRNARADELVRSIKYDMLSAVENCIEAAANEFDPRLQKHLLKSASFGKCFVDEFDSDLFTSRCKTLRVLNAVRLYNIAIPITYIQYKELTPEVVINRLIQRHQHCVAYKICEYLNMNPSRVLVHWACAKVREGADDDITCDAIVAKLSDAQGVSFATIAKTAHQYGRPLLAIKLLDFEPRAGEQVPLLITLNEDELALVKAIESGDTDLVYLAILHLKRKLSPGDFLHIIHNKPVACALLVQWCKSHDRGLLKDFYYQDDRRMERSFLQIEDAYLSPNLESRHNDLRIAMGYFSEIKEAQFYSKATEEQLALQRTQRKLEISSESEGRNSNYMDLSVADTVYALLLQRRYKQAMDIKRDFKMSDKKFWWIKLRALGFNADWIELEKMAKTRKSPIGYEPFVRECSERGAFDEAVKYISKCPVEKQVNLFCKTGFFKEAVDIAIQIKSIDALTFIKKTSNGRQDVHTLVDKAMAQLT